MTTYAMESVTQPDAHALEPDDSGGWANPRGGFLFFLGSAAIGAGMASLVPAVLTLSLKAAQLYAQHATTVLSVVVGVGSVFSLIAFPALGRISDRTTGRLGRRRPFLLLGALLFAVGAVGIILAPNTLLLTLANIVTAVGYSSAAVAFTAVIPDQFAPNRRGPASALAGIELLDDAPAYRRFRVRPRPGGGLSWVEAAHESPYGRIAVSWRLDRDNLELRVDVPAGTSAEVVLPDGRTEQAGPGTHEFRTP
jgi:hypothetical protein